jgi:hypothetical protein
MIVLAELQQPRPHALRARQIDRDRVRAAEFRLSLIQLTPARRREEIMRIGGAVQIGRQPDDGFLVTPGAFGNAVAGRHEQRSAVRDDTAGCPDTGLARSRHPAAEEARRLDLKPDDGTMIVAAITEMAAERDVKAVIEQRRRATLVFQRR